MDIFPNIYCYCGNRSDTHRVLEHLPCARRRPHELPPCACTDDFDSCNASGHLRMIRDQLVARSCRVRRGIVSGKALIGSSTRSRTPDSFCSSSRSVIDVTSIEAADNRSSRRTKRTRLSNDVRLQVDEQSQVHYIGAHHAAYYGWQS
jgi:hypothetical protein